MSNATTTSSYFWDNFNDIWDRLQEEETLLVLLLVAFVLCICLMFCCCYFCSGSSHPRHYRQIDRPAAGSKSFFKKYGFPIPGRRRKPAPVEADEYGQPKREPAFGDLKKDLERHLCESELRKSMIQKVQKSPLSSKAKRRKVKQINQLFEGKFEEDDGSTRSLSEESLESESGETSQEEEERRKKEEEERRRKEREREKRRRRSKHRHRHHRRDEEEGFQSPGAQNVKYIPVFVPQYQQQQPIPQQPQQVSPQVISPQQPQQVPVVYQQPQQVVQQQQPPEQVVQAPAQGVVFPETVGQDYYSYHKPSSIPSWH